ncbi:MAG: alpha/beta fold hydrolase [Bacteroidales bacterium]
MKRHFFIICLICISAAVAGQVDQTYYDTPYTLKTPTGEIKGTLCSPSRWANSPLVIMVAGSGPTDRNGNSPLGVESNCYQMLAWELAKKGISSVRFDKRGIGESKAATVGESALRLETYVDDVIAWVNEFNNKKSYSAIFIMGHSEGSLIGMLAAQKAPVKGYISLAGAGRPADQLLMEQLAGVPKEFIVLIQADLDSLKQGMSLQYVHPNLMAFFRPSVQEYMKSWLRYDPAAEIQKLNIPVLLVQGTTDLQVKIKEVNLLAAARPDARLAVFENMNHILKEAGEDPKTNLETYKNPDLPLKAGLTATITDFIRQHQK